MDEAPFQIRAFDLGDYEEVFALWQAVGLWMRPSDERAEIEKKLGRDPDLFLVAEERETGRIVGSVMGAWDGRRGWMYHLGVLPAWRRRGIARALVKELEHRMRGKGALKLNLIVWGENHDAKRFYERLGYRHEVGCEEWGRSL